ncbi:RNA-directed DNA polymerase, eukaryota, reverse transcriptase zinc-binding domain protein [Tanacetum coccineum]
MRRVLVEVGACKSFLDKVKINYVDGQKNVKMKKWVKVEYSWKPDRCTQCNVFGHTVNHCKDKKFATEEQVKNKSLQSAKEAACNEGFVEVRNRKDKNGVKGGKNPGFQKYKQGFRDNVVNNQVRYTYKPKVPHPKRVEAQQNDSNNNVHKQNQTDPSPKGQKSWKISNENVEALRESANKYVVLAEEGNKEDEDDPNIDKRLIWEAIKRNEKVMSDEEDVYDSLNQAVNNVIADEILGNGSEELKKFIESERVQVCAILETHLKVKNINKACNKVFGSWNWISNILDSPTSCRIVIGWNPRIVNVMVVHSCNQAILSIIESVDKRIKFFCSFIYASNSGVKRRSLWNTLNVYKRIIENHPWALMGDFNVILKPEEQSNGPSGVNNDMGEFREAINNLEIDDICSSGFNFTWTKSLKNPLSSTLKKLDRIMAYESFINDFEKAHEVILPYLISDHSPFVLLIPEGLIKKKSSFRFSNHVADKSDFMGIVRDVWKKEIKEVQGLLDSDPSNVSLKKSDVLIGIEYAKAVEDELKLLHQKAKINWLREGDQNSAYFHSVLKTRKNKSRIEIVCKDDGSRVDDDKVAEHFVDHFRNFLGKSQTMKPLDGLENYVQAKLTVEEAEAMIGMVTDEEIKAALFDIDSSKVAGPDGMSGAKRCAIKIDIQKAHDTVNWEFVRNVLILVGFHENMVKRIMNCITTASFSICLNGEVCGFFKGGRGLRQGDPISPYLFTLVMEVFNMIMIKNINASPSFKYHYGCKELKLTHLCFADDLMVLCNGDKISLNVIKKSLDEFSQVFGLFPNLNKSVIFFGSLNEDRKKELL